MKTASLQWNVRNWIQLVIFTLTVGIGIQFYLFVMQAESGGDITIARPGSVEGFLPIGALMGVFAILSPTRIYRNRKTCISCDRCTQVCPSYLPRPLGITIILIFAAMVYAAQITGHWQSRISAREFYMRLKMIDSPEVAHP